ncbi:MULTISPECIES: DUF4238 domain-containing protein [Thalassospira]|uniref:DUF4238 domain-containing protein n=2 Tax=Thalassospira TaxID=168934 RepID=A0A367W970_9PROT|nr:MULTISPECIES: DUF4238 domain-containing protein [Thalassospira]MDG4719219.1 DUF4238 domain-containing protein [Thalassospira sp. FZY0004]RCK37141.1 hypothetical protein TH19_11380 [Thalassospira profundimaris]
MAGIKQHYIPQLLLKGFGRPRGRKVVQVVVFSRENVFSTATDGVAAQRYFYSRPDGTGETLDDRITSYENGLNSMLVQLRATQRIDAGLKLKLGELVVHLCVRAAVVRESFGFAAKRIVGRFESEFSSPALARKALGIDALVLPKLVRDEFDSIYERYSVEFSLKGISKLGFRELASQWTRKNFNENFQRNLGRITEELEGIQRGINEVVENSHRNVLKQGLAPSQRVRGLERLEWRVVPCQNSDLVLPDCVAIASDNDGNWGPYVFFKLDAISRVIMPISNQFALCGAVNPSDRCLPENYNKLLASCSWQFFVSRDQNSFLDQFRPIIGAAVVEQMRHALVKPIALTS